MPLAEDVAARQTLKREIINCFVKVRVLANHRNTIEVNLYSENICLHIDVNVDFSNRSTCN